MAHRRQKLNHNQSIPRTIEQHLDYLIIIDHLFPDDDPWFYWYVTDPDYTVYDSNYAFSEADARAEAIALINEIRQSEELRSEEIHRITDGPLTARVYRVHGSSLVQFYWYLSALNGPPLATGIAKSQEDATIQATAALHFYTGGAPS